jgi:hypothetical protein
MGAVIELAFSNAIIIQGGRSGTGTTETPGRYHIEENRIKGEFNGVAMDIGAKAHITDEEYKSKVRGNAMIHSGIFNDRTTVNELNQFPSGQSITRAVDINNGSIQKLHAEDTNLNIFQENKVNRALIDKDAIFTAEGQPITASGANVIGQITPYAGKYGIGTNPESFAYFGNRKYFADKQRGVVCRLSTDGITPISDAGMKDWFKDNLKVCDTIYGAFDEQKKQYVITLEGTGIDGGLSASSLTATADITTYGTLAFDERAGGWVSFYTYKARHGVSLKNEFYTYHLSNLYRQHDEDTARGNFYDATYNDPSYVKFLFNMEPSSVKTFLTLDYEGTTGWGMTNFSTGGYAVYGATGSYDDVNTAYEIPKEGTTIGTGETVGFIKKENFYYSELRNKATDFYQDNSFFQTSGLKGYFSNITMQYWEPEESSNASKAELFSVNGEVTV